MVNTASIAGLATAPFLGPYNATKQAVVAISETLFKDLQVRGCADRASGFRSCARASSGPASPSPTATGPPGRPNERPRAPRSCAASSRTWSTVASRRRPSPTACIDAVRTNTFYILTHPELTPALRTRFDDIVEGRPPTPTAIV